MSYKQSHTKRGDILPISNKIITILRLYGTVKKVIEITKKDRRYINKYLQRLQQQGKIKWISRGVYSVIQKDCTTPNIRVYDNDCFSFHGLEMQIRLSKADQGKIKCTIYSDKKRFNVRSRNNKSEYFTLGYTGIITQENVYIRLPEDFEILGFTPNECAYKLDQIMQDILLHWERIFKVTLWKSGRINYSLVNQHWALIQNGIAKELREDQVSNYVKVYDDVDGKTAYHFDQSKGDFHLESPHPQKSPDYIEKAKQFMDHLKRDEVEQLFLDNLDLKLIAKQQHLIITKLFSSDKQESNEENLSDRDRYFG